MATASICSAVMFAIFRGPARRLASWLRLSRPCVVCGLHASPTLTPVCAACERDCFPADARRCAVCAIRLPDATAATICGACARHPPPFDATIALGDYAPPLSGMVLALKSGGQLALADTFGALLAQRIGSESRTDALVTAVPLAFERQAERGFNQAAEIARRLARDAGLGCAPDALLRVRHAAAQHELPLAERHRNVRGAFAVRSDVHGRSIWVVDDVMTSGATLGEIARMLKRSGAARVTNLIVARTP
jgi:ComF family protein